MKLQAVKDDASDQNFRRIAQALGSTPLVSSLPSTSVVGTDIYFKAAAGILWHLVYDGEATSPWKKIGGPPLIKAVDASVSVTSATYATALGGPEITPPLKGDYYVLQGCQAQLTGGASSNSSVTLFLGEAEQAELEAVLIGVDQFEGGSMISRKTRLNGLTAASVLRQRYKGFTNTLAWSYQKRWIEIDPIRVG